MKKIFLSLSLLASLSVGAQNVETPTMGWSSWNTFGVEISENIIKGQADAMVNQGLKDVGYIYVNIDDGFQYGRKADGNVQIHPRRFPNGLKPVSDYIHSLGLKAGIYSDAGDCTCGSIGSGDYYNTDVGLYGHETQDCQFYFNECEFDFIKVDYCGGIHLGLNEEAQYTAISNAIKATGRPVRYNLCRWAYPGTWAANIATSWRTTGDIYDGWASVKGILKENLYLSAYCYDGCYNDMDMLEVGRSMTEVEDITHFGMWCIMSSPLLIGCNMATIRPSALELLKNTELIALNQDPLGLQAYVVQHDGDTYVLTKDLLTLHGNTRAVALYNPSDQETVMTVSLSELDLAGETQVRDLVAHEDLPATSTAITLTVPAHGTRLLKLTAAERIERYVYEAETAFMHDYQEVSNNEALGTANYQSNSSARGGEFAGWLGGRRSNYLEWRDVYSLTGGEYTLHIAAASQDQRSFTLQLNGEDVKTVAVKTSAWTDFKEFDVTVTLQPGKNTVQLYNPSAWMPNIDYMTVEPAGSNSIIDRRLEEARCRLDAAVSNLLSTDGLRAAATKLLEETATTNNEKELLIGRLETMLQTVYQVVAVCEEYQLWYDNAEKNLQVSELTDASTTLTDKRVESRHALDAADSYSTASRALNSLKSALRAYFRSDESKPIDGQEFDMTLLITNYDLSTNTGWMGGATFRDGCGEGFDKAFDIYQTVTSLKPGIYTFTVNASYRATHNDGGQAYRNGTEVITCEFYAADEAVPVKSLYSEEWPEASRYSGVDNLNGYPHSMYAAGLRFAAGCYLNTLTLRVEKKQNVRLGLRDQNPLAGNWCCFDNFTISYKPLPDAAGIAATTAAPASATVYNLAGQPTSSRTPGVKIVNRKKTLQK